jgi:hypothetical protein
MSWCNTTTSGVGASPSAVDQFVPRGCEVRAGRGDQSGGATPGTLSAVSKSDDFVFVAADDPIVVDATAAVQHGDLEKLDALLSDHPRLATARFGDPDCHRTLLHAATDWPGNFPNGPEVVERLVRAGADADAHSRFDSHTETALHWAASSDDVAVLDARSTPAPTSKPPVPFSVAERRWPTLVVSGTGLPLGASWNAAPGHD